ncbi:hypothetical protein BDW75DRAFT_163205 [Aspergillus navahoensis]
MIGIDAVPHRRIRKRSPQPFDSSSLPGKLLMSERKARVCGRRNRQTRCHSRCQHTRSTKDEALLLPAEARMAGRALGLHLRINGNQLEIRATATSWERNYRLVSCQPSLGGITIHRAGSNASVPLLRQPYALPRPGGASPALTGKTSSNTGSRLRSILLSIFYWKVGSSATGARLSQRQEISQMWSGDSELGLKWRNCNCLVLCHGCPNTDEPRTVATSSLTS